MNFLSLLKKAERTFLVTVFLSMVALFFINIVARTLGSSLTSDLAWIEEAVRLLNVFLVFGALGLALERGRHVSIDTLREYLPLSAKRAVYKLMDTAGLAFAMYMTYLSWQLIGFVLKTGQRSPTLDIPMGWIYLAPLAGFVLLGLRYALSLFNLIDHRAQHPDDPSDDYMGSITTTQPDNTINP